MAAKIGPVQAISYVQSGHGTISVSTIWASWWLLETKERENDDAEDAFYQKVILVPTTVPSSTAASFSSNEIQAKTFPLSLEIW